MAFMSWKITFSTCYIGSLMRGHIKHYPSLFEEDAIEKILWAKV